jgi:predicted alpha-1,6-mannanase (GH76 family)
LFILTKNNTYLDIAIKIANATIKTLVYPDGILKEPCEPNCGNDGSQFKGIFLRYLMYLIESNKNFINAQDLQMFNNFITLNAETAWQKDNLVKDGRNYFGLVWNGPENVQQTIVTQISSLDLFNSYFYIKN